MGALPTSVAAAADPVSLVAGGLDSPRGVAMLDGLAIVAETGHGSNSSQVSSVDTQTGLHATIAGGLFSTHFERDIIGVSGVSVRNGKIYAVFSGSPQQTGNPDAGKLIEVKQGSTRDIASVGAFDYSWTLNVAGQERDANPTAVLATEDGFLVADSGANTITSVNREGDEIGVVKHFSDHYGLPGMAFPFDEVPTCVAQGDDALWVGTLAGNLFRVDETGATKVVVKDGTGKALLSHVTGCTTQGHTVYLVNMFGSGQPFAPPPGSNFFRGSVVQFNTESGRASELANSFDSPLLQWPYAPTVGRDGNLYVTSGSWCTAAGAGPSPAVPGCGGGGRLVKIQLSQAE